MTLDEQITDLNNRGFFCNIIQLGKNLWSASIRSNEKQTVAYHRGDTPMTALAAAWNATQLATPPPRPKKERVRAVAQEA